MKNYLFIFLLLVLNLAEAKPYRRVLVLTGGGMKTATSLGLVAGLIESGWKPDLIITTCGASIAAAEINAQVNIDSWHQFVMSDAYFHLLQNIRLQKTTGLSIYARIFNPKQADHIPRIFDLFALQIPDQLANGFALQDLSRNFSSHQIPVIMVAAQLNYGPDQAGQPLSSKKISQEVFFTDQITADAIRPFTKSPIPQQFPESLVMDDVAIRTDVTLLTAARASISDPYLVSPIKIGSKYFITGGIDLYPIELGKDLGDEVIITDGGPYDRIEVQAIKNTFGYDPNQRRRHVLEQDVDLRIDMTDESSFDKKYGFDPALKMIWLKNLIPTNRAEFLNKVEHQWKYGYDRAQQVLHSKR